MFLGQKGKIWPLGKPTTKVMRFNPVRQSANRIKTHHFCGHCCACTLSCTLSPVSLAQWYETHRPQRVGTQRSLAACIVTSAKEIMFLPLSVCLSVHKVTQNWERIMMQFWGGMIRWLDFSAATGHDADTGILTEFLLSRDGNSFQDVSTC